MRPGALVLGLGAAAVVLSACGGSSSSGSAGAGPLQKPTSLLGDVGHNGAYKISLTDQSGNPIRHLAAGTYSLSIKDESSIHDFHVTGAGVDKATSVSGTGQQTFTVTFTPGTYSFLCDTHPDQMHGKFTVS